MTEEEKKKLEAERKAALEAAKADAKQNEMLRQKGIRLIAEDFDKNVPGVDLHKEATKYISEDKSVEEFRTFVMEKFKDPEALRTPNTELDLTEREKQDYSLRKIILYQLGRLSEKEIGFELEASNALKEKTGSTERGIMIPSDVMRRRLQFSLNGFTKEERGLIVGTDASGGYTVHDQYIAKSFIDYLKDAMVFSAAGVQFIDGLVGDIPFHRELDAYTFYWAAENAGITESDITFGEEKATPKKGGVLGRYSYEFLNQSSLAVEAYVEKRLAETAGRGFDRAIGYGSGAAGQPKGIKNWTGVGSVVGTNFSRTTALAMEKLVDENTPGQNLRWMSRRALRSDLRGRNIDTGSGKFLIDDRGTEMIGYDYSLTSKMFDADDLFFGSFDNVLALMWDQLTIKASEYDDAAFKAGDVLVRALMFADVFVQYPGEIVISDAVT